MPAFATEDATDFYWEAIEAQVGGVPVPRGGWLVAQGDALYQLNDEDRSIAYSLDNGGTWGGIACPDEMYTYSISAGYMVVDGGTVYVGRSVYSNPSRVYFTRDLGVTWASFNLPMGVYASVFDVSDGVIYGYGRTTEYGQGDAHTQKTSLWISRDGGASWEEKVTFARRWNPSTSEWDQDIDYAGISWPLFGAYKLSVDDGVVYAASFNRFLLSRDLGDTWEMVDDPFREIPTVYYGGEDQLHRNFIDNGALHFVDYERGSIFTSYDQGQSWEEVTGIDEYATVIHRLFAANGSLYLTGWPVDLNTILPPDSRVVNTFRLTGIMAAGADRYSTAVRASQRSFPAGSTSVVVASGANYPDALAACTLAAVLGAPVLLSAPGYLSDVTAVEIRRLGASDVYLAGGEAALGPAVQAGLSALLTVTSVERIAGADRYETSVLLAQRAVQCGADATRVLVALGTDFPDALAAASLAALARTPVILSAPGGLGDAAKHFLASGTLGYVALVGGSDVLPDAVAAEALAASAATVERYDGSDRYGTALAVVQHASQAPWVLAPSSFHVASGANWPDALAGAAAAAHGGGMLLLTSPNALSASAAAPLATYRPAFKDVTVLGGPAALSDTVKDEVRALLG
jgi:putative cell wall-binding protein